MLKPRDVWSEGAYTGDDASRAYIFDVEDSEYTRQEWLEGIYPHLQHAGRVRNNLGVDSLESGRQLQGTVDGFLS